jgi:hypothetical protein
VDLAGMLPGYAQGLARGAGAQHLDALRAICHGIGAQAQPSGDAQGHLLVDGVILGEQEACPAAGERGLGLVPRVAGDGRQVEQSAAEDGPARTEAGKDQRCRPQLVAPHRREPQGEEGLGEGGNEDASGPSAVHTTDTGPGKRES